jgi:hypothetical protein
MSPWSQMAEAWTPTVAVRLVKEAGLNLSAAEALYRLARDAEEARELVDLISEDEE